MRKLKRLIAGSIAGLTLATGAGTIAGAVLPVSMVLADEVQNNTDSTTAAVTDDSTKEETSKDGVSDAKTDGASEEKADGEIDVIKDDDAFKLKDRSEDELSTLLKEAEDLPGLTVGLTKDVHKTKPSEKDKAETEVDGLRETEAAKLKEAIAAQKKNNAKYEADKNDPNVLLQNLDTSKGFSKANIVKFLTKDGKVDLAKVNVFDLTKVQDVEVVNTDSVGAYALYKTAFIDEATGKSVDVRISVADKFTGQGGTYSINLADKGFIDCQRQGADNSFGTFKMEFFESGTNTPINVSFMMTLGDLDNAERFSSKTAVDSYVLPDLVTPTVQVADNGTTFKGTITDSRQPHQSVQVMYRDVDNIEFEWAVAELSFTGIDFDIVVPERATTEVDILDSSVEFTADKQIMNVGFECTTCKEADKNLEEKIELVGVDYGLVDQTKVKTVMDELVNKGYLMDEESVAALEGLRFDEDADKDQDIIIKVSHKTETITAENAKSEGDDTGVGEIKYPSGLTQADLSKTITRTIHFVDANGNTLSEDVVQEVSVNRSAVFDYVTGEVNYEAWSEGTFDAVSIPSINGYRTTQSSIEAQTVSGDSSDIELKVVYDKIVTTTGTSVSSPATGDNAGILIGSLAGVGAAAAAGAVVYKKRKATK